jgi:hypothetical protein
MEKCAARFGGDWLDQRLSGPTQQVRLKMLAEYRPLLEEPGRFLLLPGEEITDKHRVLPIHVNAINLHHKLSPAGGTNVLDVIQRNFDAVLEQRRATGVPMFPHLNHPNFGWAVTAEDLMRVRGARFFEVYNGHPSVRNEGDTNHPSLERVWDIALAFRLTELNLGPLYGLAVDDSHAYHHWHRTNSNPGRGWVVVRAPALEARPLIAALEAGDFYASSGVRLRDVRRGPRALEVDIEPEPGVTYTTRFLGTRRGFDPSSQPGPRPVTSPFAVSRVYSADIGRVLAETGGPRARYEFRGDELYVRAKIISSKPKANPYAEGETEAAWVQPVVP